MRLLIILALFCAGPALFAAERAHTFYVPLPDGFTLSSRMDSEMVQYRNSNGERWTFMVMRGRGETFDKKAMRDTLRRKEEQFEALAERYKTAKAPHRLRKAELSGGGLLVAFASESYPDQMLHSHIQFEAVWESGAQASGEVSWPGTLESRVNDYMQRLEALRLLP